MSVNSFKLGELIELVDCRNSDGLYTLDNVKGISTDKKFIDTKANMDGVSLTSYKVVSHNDFSYVADTSRRGDKIAIAYNDSESNFLISSIYTVFRVKKTDCILPEYLFMFFNRPEFDRYARFNSWGSARETFSWDDFCEIELELPKIEIQHKFVAIYTTAVNNQKCYERGLNDLKLVCDGYFDKLRHSIPLQRVGNHIEVSYEVNCHNDYSLSDVRGISTEKVFIDTKANMDGVSLSSYKIVNPHEFAYVADTSRRGDKIAIAINSGPKAVIISSIYTVFRTKSTGTLIPEFLNLFFNRHEFDRYARFNSWGSARETFDYPEMEDVMIPIPSIDIQKNIACFFSVYRQRKEINEKLIANINSLCSVLIKGSIESYEFQSVSC